MKPTTPLFPPAPEGALEAVTHSGLLLHVSGWARDPASATPLHIEITVNDVVRATVVANLPRPNGAADGFAASIATPAQPARVCARTAAVGHRAGVGLGCRSLPHAVPIEVMGKTGATPPPQIATFFWVTPDGSIAKTLETVPVENGQAIYTGEPLPNGGHWAITVHDPGGLPIFRSGPLNELPGPVSSLVPYSSIRIYRSDHPAGFGLDSGDAGADFLRQRLQQLPADLRVDHMEFDGDEAGHEIIAVTGQVKVLFGFWAPFTYSLPLTLTPDSRPGSPKSVVIVEPEGTATTDGWPLGGRAAVLQQAIVGGVTTALNEALLQIADVQNIINHIGFHADLASATLLKVIPASNDYSSLEFTVHGGTISPGIGGVVVAKQ